MGLTGPHTAVRGNKIAARRHGGRGHRHAADAGHGQLVADRARRRARHRVGVPAARRVKMTAMPQMVALFNGVGGGAIALIAWVEFRDSAGFTDRPAYVAVASLFAAIVGSVSFWGSNVAFGKLQEIMPGRPISVGRLQQPLNLLMLLIAVALRRDRGRGWTVRVADGRPAGDRVGAGRADGAADRRRGHAGRDLAAERGHRAVRRGDGPRAGQHRADRRRHDRRRVRLDPHEPDGQGDEPVHPGDRRGRVRRQRVLRRRRRRRR